jgi:hypothetical protein
MNINNHYNNRRQKNVFVTKNEARLHFYTTSLSLTLNNTFASLSDGGCLGTLNLKPSRTGCNSGSPKLKNKRTNLSGSPK